MLGIEPRQAARNLAAMPGSETELADFQERLGYRFRDPSLLRQALTHPSAHQDEPGTPSNQRMEFLGDAVLGLVLTERLHALYAAEREGQLTKRRATLARGACLAQLARDLGVDAVLRVSASERSIGGHRRATALEDAIEALAAAVYLDSDWETARRVVLAWYGDLGERIARHEVGLNPKGALQELVQPKHGNAALGYRVISMEGPPHKRRFEVEALLNAEAIGRGCGASKKEAEEAAAADALTRIAAASPANP
jgi:ribonuclease-3